MRPPYFLVKGSRLQLTGMEIEFHEDELSEVAKKICQHLSPGDALALSGSLAAGKTTLTGAIARELGYTGRVSSPTFVLERIYPIEKGPIRQIAHLDFYRLSKNDLASFDWQEALQDKNRLTIIEWPEVAKELLPLQIKRGAIEIIDEKTRKIRFDTGN